MRSLCARCAAQVQPVQLGPTAEHAVPRPEQHERRRGAHVRRAPPARQRVVRTAAAHADVGPRTRPPPALSARRRRRLPAFQPPGCDSLTLSFHSAGDCRAHFFCFVRLLLSLLTIYYSDCEFKDTRLNRANL